MKVIGIDPGLKGAVASWDGTTLVSFQMPTVKAASRGNEVDWTTVRRLMDALIMPAEHAFLERVSARPGEGVASVFKFGGCYEGLRAMTAFFSIPTTRVTPTQWKRAMQVSKEKEAAVARANELFPGSSEMFRGPRGGILDGVAEAALLAWYGRNKLIGGSQ